MRKAPESGGLFVEARTSAHVDLLLQVLHLALQGADVAGHLRTEGIELGSAGADAMIVVRQPDVSRYGGVEVDGAGFVSAFHEKSESSRGGWINAGICALRAEHFTCWSGQRMSLEKDVFPKLVAARLLRAVPLESDFIDIGIPEDYLRFCRWQGSGREGRLCN